MNVSHRIRRCLPRTTLRVSSIVLIATLTAFASFGVALAQQATTAAQTAKPQAAAQSFPAWEQLTAEQREALIATVRDHWNQNPQQRTRIMNHAQRWRQLTPEQRQRAMKGRHRWDQMTPEQRAKARTMFEQRERISPEERAALREKLKAMTPEQRREWLKQHRGQWQQPHRQGMQGGHRDMPPPPPSEPRR
jgi:myosin heavy subunit